MSASLRRAALAALLAAACEKADGANDAGANDAPVVRGPYEPGPAAMRRLTKSQYLNTLRDVFGADVVLPASLEPDTAREGSFAVGASESAVSRRGVEQFQAAAYDLAAQCLDETRRARIVGCTPTAMRDDDCARSTLKSLARRLWRRPVGDNEVAPFVAVAGAAGSALGDFHRGLQYGVAGVLQSVETLYRPEVGAAGTAGGRTRHPAIELASRLAFLLWDAGPDDELLRAAEDGSLDRPEGLRAQVDRMLRAEKSRRGIRAFVTEWLGLGALEQVSRDATLFPAFNAELATSSREETLRLAEHLALERDEDFRALLTTRTTFVNRRLAALYNVRFPGRVSEGSPNDFARIEFADDDARRGILGHASILLLNAHPTSTSPTLRGKFIREAILCSPIPAPPVNVNTAIPEASMRLPTLRQRIAEHNTNISCRGCHELMDPIGLSLETFDGIGRARTLDNGVRIDTRGNIGAAPFRDARELAQVLHDHPDTPRCMVKRLYRFAYGRVETPGEFGELGRLQQGFAANGYRLRWLLGEIATSEAFRTATVPAGVMP